MENKYTKFESKGISKFGRENGDHNVQDNRYLASGHKVALPL